eukprot:3640981-Prymnesium_polylepis.1
MLCPPPILEDFQALLEMRTPLFERRALKVRGRRGLNIACSDSFLSSVGTSSRGGPPGTFRCMGVYVPGGYTDQSWEGAAVAHRRHTGGNGGLRPLRHTRSGHTARCEARGGRTSATRAMLFAESRMTTPLPLPGIYLHVPVCLSRVGE